MHSNMQLPLLISKNTSPLELIEKLFSQLSILEAEIDKLELNDSIDLNHILNGLRQYLSIAQSLRCDITEINKLYTNLEQLIIHPPLSAIEGGLKKYLKDNTINPLIDFNKKNVPNFIHFSKLYLNHKIKSKSNNSLLHLLTIYNKNNRFNEEIKELLTNYSADINHLNAEGYTPLQCLISGRFGTESAMKLVRLGADPDSKDTNGNSLLEILARWENNTNGKNDKAIEELVNVYKANINIRNAKGYTPLQCLISGRFGTESAMKLVRLGADPDTKDTDGNSLLEILARRENNTNGKNDKAIEELVNVYNAIRYISIANIGIFSNRKFDKVLDKYSLATEMHRKGL